LLLIGLVYFIHKKARRKACFFSLIFFCGCMAAAANSGSLAFWEKNILYEGESIYNYLQVKETDSSVILSTNVLFGVQSIMKKDDSLTGMYYDYALAAPVMAGLSQKENSKILVLGMGTGTYARECQKYFTEASVEGVEIDQKITDLASTYFKLPADIKVTNYDGRAYLSATDQKYDVIMVDAYQDITIPFQMSSTEFFDLVKNHLTDNGVMVVNMNMHTEKEGNINQYLADTIASVFHTVYTVNVDGSSNRELFAMKQRETSSDFLEAVETVKNQNLKNLMLKTASGMKRYERGAYLLTDDKAPVELLGMRVIDELIQAEVVYYRRIFNQQGLDGMLKEILS